MFKPFFFCLNTGSSDSAVVDIIRIYLPPWSDFTGGGEGKITIATSNIDKDHTLFHTY
jgi:hypothetical protein